MKYLLNIGGKTHPETRVEVFDALKAFFQLYGEEPSGMTIMPCGMVPFMKMLRQDADSFYENEKSETMLRDGKAIMVCGLRLTLGPTYTLSR